MPLYKLDKDLQQLAKDPNVGDVNPNAPVGSTIALIEQGSKSFSAIHKKIAQMLKDKEFKLLAKLNAKYLPEQLDFAMSGVSSVIMAKTLMVGLMLYLSVIQIFLAQHKGSLKHKQYYRWQLQHLNCMMFMKHTEECMRQSEYLTSMRY